MQKSDDDKIKQVRAWQHERGVQLLEVAVVLPVLLILLAATVEFGRYFYVYSTLSGATRTTARYVASTAFKSTAPQDNAAAINLALCGSTATCQSGTEIISGLKTEHFQITTQGGTRYFPTLITVQINYRYTPLFPLSNVAPGVSWSEVSIQPSTTLRFMPSN